MPRGRLGSRYVSLLVCDEAVTLAPTRAPPASRAGVLTAADAKASSKTPTTRVLSVSQHGSAVVIRQWWSSWRESADSERSHWPAAEALALVRVLLGEAPGTRPEDQPHEARRNEALWIALSSAARRWALTMPSIGTLIRHLSILRRILIATAEDRETISQLSELLDLALVVAVEELVAGLEGEAMHDPLTGAGNRRWLNTAAAAAIDRAAQSSEPICVVAIDLDGLKRINDKHGHNAGDEAIKRLVAALVAAARGTDQVFRIGGDEFVVLLPSCKRHGAEVYLKRVEDFLPPKFSYGIADTTEGKRTLESLLQLADERLYAKRSVDPNRVDRDAPVPAAPGVVSTRGDSKRASADRRKQEKGSHSPVR